MQVSLGKEPITIPAGIVGMSVSNATKALEDLGLSVGGVQGNPSQKVTGTNPGIGTRGQAQLVGHPHHQVARSTRRAHSGTGRIRDGPGASGLSRRVDDGRFIGKVSTA